MAAPLTRSSCPSGHLYDFDLVTVDGRPLVVGTPDRDHRAFTWDPARDIWTEHTLANPWFHDEDGDYTEITSLAAAVVDGRIVIAGGGDHQGFAQWDLESGAVRLHALDGGVASATAVDFAGQSLFVYGGTSETAVQVWEPTVPRTGESADPGDQPFPRILRVEIWELSSRSLSASAVAGGMIDDQRVVVGGDRSGGVLLWDIDGRHPTARLDVDGATPKVFALVDVDGRAHVVAGGERLMLGDPSTREWVAAATPEDTAATLRDNAATPGDGAAALGDGAATPGDGAAALGDGAISCLTAAVVNGRPIAVTGSEGGKVHAWDLAGRRLVSRQVGEHSRSVDGVAITELDGRPVVISNSRRDAICVWQLAP
ncbi:hypothetical protein [Actinomadura rupiterrae]|uniref:hypothetical protein n=1 Tax=Actinomadura rupiterrae TaxID=559627 RepID=UPI0020A2CB74|nr:hypothetical protein [Actinomadura rupiterrae]MCP2339369.1 WD40 repeat protein [Actinomadura rupiterrae]